MVSKNQNFELQICYFHVLEEEKAIVKCVLFLGNLLHKLAKKVKFWFCFKIFVFLQIPEISGSLFGKILVMLQLIVQLQKKNTILLYILAIILQNYQL